MCWICRRTEKSQSGIARMLISAKLTGQAEEDQPVYNKDRPEDRQVEDLEPAAEESNSDGLGRRVPELELWETAHKRPEFLVLLGGEATRVSILHTLILL